MSLRLHEDIARLIQATAYCENIVEDYRIKLASSKDFNAKVMFNLLDEDKTDKINASNLQNIAKDFGLKLDKSVSQKIIKQYRKEQGDFLTYKDFLKMCLPQNNPELYKESIERIEKNEIVKPDKTLIAEEFTEFLSIEAQFHEEIYTLRKQMKVWIFKYTAKDIVELIKLPKTENVQFNERVLQESAIEISIDKLLDYIRPGMYQTQQMSAMGPEFNDAFSKSLLEKSRKLNQAPSDFLKINLQNKENYSFTQNIPKIPQMHQNPRETSRLQEQIYKPHQRQSFQEQYPPDYYDIQPPPYMNMHRDFNNSGRYINPYEYEAPIEMMYPQQQPNYFPRNYHNQMSMRNPHLEEQNNMFKSQLQSFKQKIEQERIYELQQQQQQQQYYEEPDEITFRNNYYPPQYTNKNNNYPRYPQQQQQQYMQPPPPYYMPQQPDYYHRPSYNHKNNIPAPFTKRQIQDNYPQQNPFSLNNPDLSLFNRQSPEFKTINETY